MGALPLIQVDLLQGDLRHKGNLPQLLLAEEAALHEAQASLLHKRLFAYLTASGTSSLVEGVIFASSTGPHSSLNALL